MNDPLLKENKGIILAADLISLDDLRRFASLSTEVSGVVAIKVGFSLALRYGLPSVLEAISEVSDVPVIYDHQKGGTDIPSMGGPFARACAESGVRGVIYFPLSGPRTLESFVSAAFSEGLIPIVGLVMTHEAYLASEGGYIMDEAPRVIGELALRLGVKHLVLPGNRPKILAKLNSDFLAAVSPLSLMMPGIGSQGGEIRAAFEALPQHHRFAIVGSSVYRATDPRSVLEGFVAEL